MGKKVLMLHFRVGRTDGVSLEIINWKKAMERKGAEVRTGSGVVNVGADFVIQGLEHELDEESAWIRKTSLGPKLNKVEEEKFKERFYKKVEEIEKGLMAVFGTYQPDLLIVSNIFSVGENVAAAVALTNCLDVFGTRTIAIHHDFYWESNRYGELSCEFIKKMVEEYLPIKRKWVAHACINSLAQKELWERKRIEASVIYDNIDFDQKEWESPKELEEVMRERGLKENDLMVLQATRVVRRKNIELAIDLVAEMNLDKYKTKLAGVNEVVLVLAGYAEKREEKYLEMLIDYAKSKKVKMILLADVVGGLEEVYPMADAVSYPSEFEGFGNQFLEAVFAKKVVAMFEYPVFKSDIGGKGFEIVSLGDKLAPYENLKKIPKVMMEKAASELIDILMEESEYRRIVEKNFELGKKYFSTEVAMKKFEEIIKQFNRNESTKARFTDIMRIWKLK